MVAGQLADWLSSHWFYSDSYIDNSDNNQSSLYTAGNL